MFKPVFLKQFRQFHFFKTLGYLYVALKIREIEYVCEKGSIERRERGCWQNLYRGTKNFWQRMWKAYTSFSLQHKTFSAWNYAQDFGITVKQSLKRTTSSKWATLTKSRIVPCHVMTLSALSTMSLSSVKTVIKFTNWIQKIMVQFCYLRLYFGIDYVSRPLLQRIARIKNTLKRRPTSGYRTYSNQISTTLIPIK